MHEMRTESFICYEFCESQLPYVTVEVVDGEFSISVTKPLILLVTFGQLCYNTLGMSTSKKGGALGAILKNLTSNESLCQKCLLLLV